MNRQISFPVLALVLLFCIHPEARADPLETSKLEGHWLTWDEGECHLHFTGNMFLLSADMDGVFQRVCGFFHIDQDTIALFPTNLSSGLNDRGGRLPPNELLSVVALTGQVPVFILFLAERSQYWTDGDWLDIYSEDQNYGFEFRRLYD